MNAHEMETDRLYEELKKPGNKWKKVVDEIEPLLQRIAGNRRFMALAGPAREALNIIKRARQ